MNEIRNAYIRDVELTMADHGVFVMWVYLEGDGWGGAFGGHVLGKGSLGAEKFSGGSEGIEYIERIMDTVGVSEFSDLKGKYVRVTTEKENFFTGRTFTSIGNIIKEKWFTPREFFKEKLGDEYED